MTQNKSISLRNNFLQLNPAGYNINIYGIAIKYPKKNLVIHYEITCTFLKRISSTSFLLTLNRQQVFINNKPPANKLYNMASEMAACLYPVTIEIGGENKILSVVNHDEIITRSKKAIEKISAYYKGEAAEECILQFQKHCSNPKTIIAALETDLFYKLLFLPLHTQYTATLTTGFATTFSFGGKKMPLPVTVTLMPQYNEKGKLVANVHGQKDDAGFTAQYQLYPEDHTVFFIAGAATYPENGNTKGNMEFEVHHINTEERIIYKAASFAKDQDSTHNKERVSLLMEEEAQPRKRGFWNKFR